MAERRQSLLIVNPYSSVDYFLRKVAEYGLDIVVLSAAEEARLKPDVVERFAIRYRESARDLEADLAWLRAIDRETPFLHASIGSEYKYAYSERIVRALFPDRSNDPATAAARSDKYVMGEMLKAAGLDHIDQELLPADIEVDEALERAVVFFRRHGGGIVLKPHAETGSSLGVVAPPDEAVLRAHVEQVAGTRAILMQRKIVGREYLVDTVSLDGTNQVTFVGYYRKSEAAGLFMYQFIHSSDPRSAEALAIRAYVERVLNVLGFRWGLAHIEIMESDGHYYLIELNPRISGAQGMVNHLAEESTGVGQVDVYLSQLLGRPRAPYEDGQSQAVYFFKTLTLQNTEAMHERLRALASFECCLDLDVPDGRIRKYDSLRDVPMFLHLKNADPARLDADLEAVADIERSGDASGDAGT